MRLARISILLILLFAAGCLPSPEDGRPRGGGHGGDGRNVPPAGIDPPSKIDGTRDLERYRPPIRS